jgi:hypothetical protein
MYRNVFAHPKNVGGKCRKSPHKTTLKRPINLSIPPRRKQQVLAQHTYINANLSGTTPFSQSNKGQKLLLKRGEMWKKFTQNYSKKANKPKHSS